MGVVDFPDSILANMSNPSQRVKRYLILYKISNGKLQNSSQRVKPIISVFPISNNMSDIM